MNSGPAGLQAAKDLAGAGVDVVVAERNSWVGGRLCQLGRVFQSEGWPSICDSVCVGPVQARGAVLSERVRLLTGADVIAAERRDGGFSVTVRQAPRYVDADRCIACDLCAQACPEEAPRAFDRGLTRRKAIDREFERALPGGYVLLDEVCTRCGDCVPVCPTDAIDLDAQPTSTTEEFGAVFLATGTTPLDLTGYSDLLATDGDVVDALTFEQLMASGLRRPSDGEEPESVVFVQCAGSRAGPDKQGQGVPYCSKTCCSVTAKQVDRLATGFPMVESTVVYYRDMRPRMFDRWRQENYFKYMRQEYALDALVEHGVEAADPSRPVPNPARKALDKELRQAKREVERLEAEYGAAAIDNPEKKRRTMRGFKIAHGTEIGIPLRDARARVEELVEQRRQVPTHVPVGEVRDEVVRLPRAKKRLTDGLKMLAYQVETDLVRLVAPFYARSLDEGRPLVTAALQSAADLEVTDDELRVNLAPQSSPHRSRAIAGLCALLDATETVFPGTALRLRYAVDGVESVT